LSRVLLCVASMALLVPRASQAGQGCAELLQKAKTAFADGAFRRARETLERALRCSPPPGAALQARIHLLLGLVHATRGHDGRAREAFRRALKYDPEIKLDPRRHRADFVELLENVRGRLVGRVAITTDIEKHAEVWADDRSLCRPPCTAPLLAGPYRLVLRGPDGRVLASRTVEVIAGRSTTVELRAPPSTRPASRLAAARRPPTRAAPRPPPLRTPPPRRRLWTWVAAGTAVASAAAALGLGLSARGDHDQACDLLSGDGPCDERTHLRDPADAARYGDLHAAMERKSLASNICWGVAGGLAVTAAVLFWLEPGWGREARVTLLPGSGGLVAGLSY